MSGLPEFLGGLHAPPFTHLMTTKHLLHVPNTDRNPTVTKNNRHLLYTAQVHCAPVIGQATCTICTWGL